MPDGVTVSTLSIDYVAGAEASADHLLSHGYRTLGVVTGLEDSPGTSEHRRGVERALTAHPQASARYVAAPVSRFAARDAVRPWLKQKRPPRAIYCSTAPIGSQRDTSSTTSWSPVRPAVVQAGEGSD